MSPGQVTQLVKSIHPICQGCRFDSWSGHMEESISECINKWNNKSMFLSLLLLPPSSLSVSKSINKNFKRLNKGG